jgi:hypothetical protein
MKSAKVIVSGSRHIPTKEARRVLREVIVELKIIPTAIIHGNQGYVDDNKVARGVDVAGETLASELKIPVYRFNADWTKYGRKAGPIRNGEMAEEGEFLIALWDGRSRGTLDMIQKATIQGLQVFIEPYYGG